MVGRRRFSDEERRLRHIESNRKYYQNHKKRKKQHQREYRQAHKEQIKQYQREYHLSHKVQDREKAKKYYQNHKEEEKQHQKGYYKLLRLKLMQILGGAKCVLCSEDNYHYLHFDHINGGGNKDRKRFKNNTNGMYNYYTNHPDEARSKLRVL